MLSRAFVYEGFLTEEECDHLISLVGSSIFMCLFSVSLGLDLTSELVSCWPGEIGAQEVGGGG